MEQISLDEALSRRLKDEGLDAVESREGRFVDVMRQEAIRISRSRGWVTSDDLRVYASQHDCEPAHQNCWGAIFRGPSWRVIGRRRSAVPGNHSREIKIWQYVKGGDGDGDQEKACKKAGQEVGSEKGSRSASPDLLSGAVL